MMRKLKKPSNQRREGFSQQYRLSQNRMKYIHRKLQPKEMDEISSLVLKRLFSLIPKLSNSFKIRNWVQKMECVTPGLEINTNTILLNN